MNKRVALRESFSINQLLRPYHEFLRCSEESVCHCCIIKTALSLSWLYSAGSPEPGCVHFALHVGFMLQCCYWCQHLCTNPDSVSVKKNHIARGIWCAHYNTHTHISINISHCTHSALQMSKLHMKSLSKWWLFVLLVSAHVFAAKQFIFLHSCRCPP